MEASAKVWEIGSHRIFLEGGDTIHIVFRGTIARPDAEEVKRLVLDLGDRYGKLYVIFDASQFTSVEPGARAAWSHMDRPWPIRYLVAYGASFWGRTLAMTVNRAGRALAPRFFDYDFEFVATEADAWRSVEERRGGRE
jgi:hypothetical protein